MSSCFLFHGPGARDAATAEADRLGRQVHAPMGVEGLRTDDAREAVALLSSPPVGDDCGVLIIGPMDEANQKACDVLLKSIEEHRDGDVQPVLWAWDLAEVSSTIRSRCIPQWSLGEGDEIPEELLDTAWQLCDAIIEGELYQVLASLKENKGELESLGRAVARCVAENVAGTIHDPQQGAEGFLAIWEALRPELRHYDLSPVGFSHVLLRAALPSKGA
jgi:hypothetical protein